MGDMLRATPCAPTSHVRRWQDGIRKELVRQLTTALQASSNVKPGKAAELEAISELRLSVPRGALLREVVERGWEAAGPENRGWPDSGVEVNGVNNHLVQV